MLQNYSWNSKNGNYETKPRNATFHKKSLGISTDYSWKVVTIPLLDHLLAQLTLLGTGFKYGRRAGINHAQYFLKYSTKSFENLFSCNSTYSELIDWRKNLMTLLFLMTSSFFKTRFKKTYRLQRQV